MSIWISCVTFCAEIDWSLKGRSFFISFASQQKKKKTEETEENFLSISNVPGGKNTSPASTGLVTEEKGLIKNK